MSTDIGTPGRQNMVTYTLGLGVGSTLRYDVNYASSGAGDFAAIRAGTEIQALAFQTAPSREYMSRFRRDGKSVSDLLSERDSTFADYRERKSDG